MASKQERDGSERSAKRRKLVVRSRDGTYLDVRGVDESDRRIAEKLFTLFMQFNKNMRSVWRDSMQLCSSHPNGRIYSLFIPQLGRPIPEDILRMDALEELEINCDDMAKVANWFPRRFGTLTSVKKLDLFLGNGYVPPEEISDLPNLEYLRIEAQKKVIIPRSFGNLHNLEKISIFMSTMGDGSVSLPKSLGKLTKLKHMEIINLSELPKDSECFASLESLNLRGNLETIPSYIGTLKSLKKLTLGRPYDEREITLPNAIGDLTCLEVLCLQRIVTTLPSSIGKLKNLKILDLESNDIPSLPDEIGDAINLEVIDIGRTKVRTLPSSITNLKKLRRLNLSHEILKEHNVSRFQMISNLINDLPQLGCLGYPYDEILDWEPETPETLSFAYSLMRNRAKTRLNSFNSRDGGISSPIAAWPLAMHQAMKLCRPYGLWGKYDDVMGYDICWCCERKLIKKMTTQSDAIFLLLVNYGATIIAKGHA